MAGSHDLLTARTHLERAEATFDSAEGLRRLEEGLALLDGVEDPLAVALANTYATRIVGRIRERVETDPALPEPELEHLFKVVLAFDESPAPTPEPARALKIRIARRLIDCYYEGSPPEEKERATAELMRLAGVRSRGKRS